MSSWLEYELMTGRTYDIGGHVGNLDRSEFRPVEDQQFKRGMISPAQPLHFTTVFSDSFLLVHNE